MILCTAVAILTGCGSEGMPLDGNRSIFTTRGVLLHGTPPRPLSQVRAELVDLSGPKFSPLGPTGPQALRRSETTSDRSGRFTISIPNSVHLRDTERRGSLALKITSDEFYMPVLIALQPGANAVYHVDFPSLERRR